MKLKGRVQHLVVLEGSTPDELIEAFDEWRKLAEENGIVGDSIYFEDDGVDLRLAFMYATEGVELKARVHQLEILSAPTIDELIQAFEDWRLTAEETAIARASINWSFAGADLRIAFLYATE